MTSSAAAVDSSHVHSSSPLTAFDQVQGVGYFDSEVETDVTTLESETVAALKLEKDAVPLELETDVVPLQLETEMDMSQEISKQKLYSAD
jgi:hypothetical protein